MTPTLPSARLRIFVSSVQKELASERRALADLVRNDALLRRFFDVFLFEELPASDQRADEVYLSEVGRADLYRGLFASSYGWQDAAGVSPTEREFDEATRLNKVRLIFPVENEGAPRHPKMEKLIERAGGQLIRRRVASTPELVSAVYASLVDELERTGRLRTRAFDAAACPGALRRHAGAGRLRAAGGRSDGSDRQCRGPPRLREPRQRPGHALRRPPGSLEPG